LLISALDGGEQSASCPGQFIYPWGKCPWYPLDRELGGPQSQSGHGIDFEKAHDSVRREIFYNILNEFGIPVKQFRLINTCLNEICSKVCIGRSLSDAFPL